jgi:hypothetical protein
MYELGYRFDLGVDAAPVDLSAAAVTGKRTNVRDCQNINILVVKGAASSGTDPVLTFNQWQASSGGSAAVFNPDHFYQKAGATLANTETWSKVAVSTTNGQVTLTGEQGHQGLYLFEINVKDLTDGYDYVSVDTAKAGTVAQIGALLYIAADLVTKRYPPNLQALLH